MLDVPMVDPQFKKYKDASKPIRSNEYMTYPIYTSDGELCLNIQLMSKKKRNSKFAAGFTNFDEVFLQIVSAVI